MKSITRSIYRTLLKKSQPLDRHRPLKLLLSPLHSECTSFIKDAFKFYSIRFEPQFYDSSHSLKQHIRITFDFIKFIQTNPNHSYVISLNKNYLNAMHLTQLGFDTMKILSITSELISYIKYDINYIESLPQNNVIPCRLSDPIKQELDKADDTIIGDINEACMFIKLGNACDKIEDKISYFAKSIDKYETSDAYTYIGWMLYTLSIKQDYKNDNENSETQKLKMSPILTDIINNDKTNAITLKEEILEYIMKDDYINKLNGMDGINLCMKCDRIAVLLDPSFGNPWNDLGVCLMNQLFISDQSDKALELFEKAKLCYRYSSREYPFVNSARLYLRHKKDVKNAIKEYLGALHFDRDLSEAISAIKEYRETLLKAMHRKQNKQTRNFLK
eukprot:405736_1